MRSIDNPSMVRLYHWGIYFLKMSKVKDENYIVIEGWMLNNLHLKGNELLIYAIIYGFSQYENHAYSGGLQYLMDWTLTTKKTVIGSLNSLVQKGLIIKEEEKINNVVYHRYSVKEIGGVKTTLGGVKTTPNNIYNIINNTSSIIDNNNDKANNIFIKPTIEEIQEYLYTHNITNVNAEEFFYYYESNGWKVGKNKMKNWKATINRWKNSEYNNKKPQNGYTDWDWSKL